MRARVNSMRRLVTTVFAIIALASGCSLLNREGPTDTCRDLKNGAVNACKNGIIATCSSDKQNGVTQWSMQYDVCDDKNVCSASWQGSDAYNCDPPPADGGVPAGGIKPDGGGYCGTGDVCVIATSGGQRPIAGFAVDGSNVYFHDGRTVWSVPRAGGFATTLATDASDKNGFVVTDSKNVYVPEPSKNRIVAISKTGGDITTAVATGGGLQHFTADSTRFFWTEDYGSSLHAQLQAGGSPETLATSISAGNALVAAGGWIFWGPVNSKLYRISASATAPTSPAALDFTSVVGDKGSVSTFAVDSSGLYFGGWDGSADGSAYAVWKVALDGSNATKLAANVGNGQPSFMGLSDTSIYWHGNLEVLKVAKSGGTASILFTGSGYASVASLLPPVADDKFVYWADGTSMMRAPK